MNLLVQSITGSNLKGNDMTHTSKLKFVPKMPIARQLVMKSFIMTTIIMCDFVPSVIENITCQLESLKVCLHRYPF